VMESLEIWWELNTPMATFVYFPTMFDTTFKD